MNKYIVLLRKKSGVQMENLNLVNVDLNRDIQKITKYIQDYIDSTYLEQIRKQVKTYKRQYTEEPSPQIQLLNSIIPFVGEESKDRFTQMIKMISYAKMIESMLPSYRSGTTYNRENNEVMTPNDYIQQAVVSLVLYQLITWAEE